MKKVIFLFPVLMSLLIIPKSFAQQNGSFIDAFFIQPLVQGTGYNIVNTATFGIILIAAAFVVYKILKKLRIKIDRSFLIGVIPFVAMGGIFRAWEDLGEATGAARNFLFISPLIYVTIFVIAFVSLLAVVAIERAAKNKISY